MPWIKSILNHFWWCCATSIGNPVMLKEKWLSILYHITNRHTWKGCKHYSKCAHAKLGKKEQRKKPWLKIFKAERNCQFEPFDQGSEIPLWFQPHWHVRDLPLPVQQILSEAIIIFVWGNGCSITTRCNGSQLVHRSQTGWNKEGREAFQVELFQSYSNLGNKTN